MSALYRTHRPLDLSQVVGQAHIVRTLTNAIEHDRVAHAYLFAGPRGTGKTSLAKILAKSLNCEQGPTVTPCLVCESCRTIHDATAIDVIEMDAASHRGIDDVREINDRIGLRPVLGRRKIYIVDEAHMLTKEASNAVLKTLEEPPDHVVFVLCTTEMQSMLPTIRSRCQRFAFHRPTHAEIGEVLERIATAESIEIDPSAVSLVARAAGGSFRDAVSLLDQLRTACSERITAEDARQLLGTADEESLFAALDLVAAGDAPGALRWVDGLAEAGTDLAQITSALLGHLRGIFLTQQLGAPPEDLDLTAEEGARIAEQAQRVSPMAAGRLIDLLRDVLAEVREGADPRLPLELALVKVCRPQGELSLEALSQRLERLEGGAPRSAPVPAPVASEQAAAPEPAPKPAPPPAPAAASADAVDARWQDAVLPEVERRSPPLRGLLEGAHPTGYEDGVVTIAFATPFNRTGAESSENAELLTEVVGQALGTAVRLRMTASETTAEPVPETGAEPAALEPVSEDALFAQLKETFDAREV